MNASCLKWVCFIVFSSTLLESACSLCQADQQSILLNLKDSFNYSSPKSTKLVYWDSTKDCCNWTGISCDSSGQVIGLDLANESIWTWDYSQGVSGLRHLRNLNLSFNSFNISIPPDLANWTQLTELNLSNAGFTGQIPIQLSQMENLSVLDLSVSLLYGDPQMVLKNPNMELLVKNLHNLKELYLDGIDLNSNSDNWCQVLSSHLPRLEVVSLKYCSLSGSIDSSLTDLRSLSRIYLTGNDFSFQVPTIFSRFSKLKSLTLSSCSLNGSFPEAILLMPSLETIDLTNNKNLSVTFPHFNENLSFRELRLSDTNIYGALPDYVRFPANLSRLEAVRCQLTGKVPTSLGKLSQLSHLDLSSNNLSSTIPSFRMAINLKYLDLSGNKLFGEIVSEYFQDLKSLQRVLLSKNLLNGTIPQSLCSSSSLELLDLSENNFRGQIPAFRFVSHSSLKTLRLDSNNLNGSIPSSVFNLGKLNVLSLQFNKLSGNMDLDIVKTLPNLTSLDLSYNQLTISVKDTSGIPFQQFSTFRLASCNLTAFPELGNQSKLSHLDLSNNSIARILPWLENHANSSLTFLNLSYNNLATFPNLSLFGNLSLLDMHNNRLKEDVPELPARLVYLDLSMNNYFSVIPESYATTFQQAIFISFASNNISGGITESFCNVTSLKVLDLSENMLEGPIPSCLFTNNNLVVLNLKLNKLNGTIADNFQFDDCKLKTLDFNSNYLEGKVPRSLSNCSLLEVLDIGNNFINDTFPCGLNRTSLRVLILRNNYFSGKIGCEAINGGWPSLQIVDLATNKFHGNLSEEGLLSWKAMMDGGSNLHDHFKFSTLRFSNNYYQDSITLVSKGVQVELVKILTVYISVDFSCNQLEGPLPEAIGNLTAIYLLNLSHNSFSGQIPSSFGKIALSESLDLSYNKLSGKIPQQLVNLTFLAFLNLSYNNFSGTIPLGSQFQSFSNYSYIGNPGLCGPPLKFCNNQTASNQSSYRKINDVINWLFVLPGMGFGMGAAAVVAPIMFCNQTKIWFEEIVDKILIWFLPFLGCVYYTKTDWRRKGNTDLADDHPNSDDDEADDDDGNEMLNSDFIRKEIYCVYCTKLDPAMRGIVHDQRCACYRLPSTFLSSVCSAESQ